MRTKKPPPDCLTCGACCVSLHDQNAFCDVDYEDLKLLGPRLAKTHVVYASMFDRLLQAISGTRDVVAAIATKWRRQKTGPLKGIDLCACIFLRGSVMNRVRCTIYDKRPRVCHEAVKPGDRSCRRIRFLLQDAVEEAA